MLKKIICPLLVVNPSKYWCFKRQQKLANNFM